MVNSSAKAQRRIAALSATSGYPEDVVRALACVTWDFDAEIGWVSSDPSSPGISDALAVVAAHLRIAVDFDLTRIVAVEEVLAALARADMESLWRGFIDGVSAKSYAHLSEFATHHYLRNATALRLQALDWDASRPRLLQIARCLFLKLFRGGAVDRGCLDYVWCDLKFTLEHELPARDRTPWLGGLVAAVESAQPSGLSQLVACGKGLIPGDKHFKQEVLQALAYADVLRMPQHPVLGVFLPEHQQHLSGHFYSNEWTYPLRFWPEQPGIVNRAAIPTAYRS